MKIRFEVPPELDLRELRVWCAENCIGNYKVSNPANGYGIKNHPTVSNRRTLGTVRFTQDVDAMAFKLRWI